MSDAVKWALLGAAILTLIVMIFTLPIVNAIDLTAFTDGIATIIDECAGFLISARGLVNCFFTPPGRVILTAILVWLFGKFLLTNSIKIVAWIYHFIFK